MSERKKCCEKPEELKGKPEECTPEQIRKCHGDAREHPCESDADDDCVDNDE
ncbi:MAG: hypothetical protein ACODAD_05810 [Planctomycetota bacterium]